MFIVEGNGKSASVRDSSSLCRRLISGRIDGPKAGFFGLIAFNAEGSLWV
jgi:hypothetical protein